MRSVSTDLNPDPSHRNIVR